jgi:peroxiredoxin
MKLLTTLLVLTAMVMNPTENQLNIGDKAPGQDLELKNIDGNTLTLEKLKGEKGLLVIYSCNTCPWVVAWEDRYNELYKYSANEGIGFVLVNSNEAKREGDDSLDEMKKHAQEKGYFNFAYVVDENHQLADLFGATKTPDVFLFNADLELVYKGAIDDNSKDKNAVEEPYLMNALKALSAGKKIKPETTKALGCSIKRIKS